MEGTGDTRRRMRLLGRSSVIAFFLLVAAVRALAVFYANVNWDEAALLQRAENLVRTGVLIGGGRPGLVTLALAPFAEACTNAVLTLVQIRHFWTAMVFASAVAFCLLFRSVLPRGRTRWVAIATGLGLWVLASHFLRFSVQVRTDQPAILLGLWAGVVLMASRRRPALALLGGALFAGGFLASQKLLYVAGLVGIVAGGWHLVHGEVRWRRELLRVGLTVAGFGLMMVAFRTWVAPLSPGGPDLLPVSSQLRTFQFYRETSGFHYYREMLPELVSQVMVVGLLFIVTLDWARNRGRHGAQIAVAWVVLVAGAVVVAFHAGRFPYFYMVLGLFPASIGALVMGPMLERVDGLRQEMAVLAVVWVPLVAIAFVQLVFSLEDGQSRQRDSLAFVQANFPPEARGFNSRAAFVCRHDPDPFPVWFAEHLRRFEGDGAEAEIAGLLAEFRSRPVQFLVEPLGWEAYPGELRDFWATRYVLYRGHVRIPGREIRGEAGRAEELEIIVPGEYRWWADEATRRPLVVGADTVPAGGVVTLSQRGVVRLGLPEGGGGMFALSVAEPPAPDTTPFYRRF